MKKELEINQVNLKTIANKVGIQIDKEIDDLFADLSEWEYENLKADIKKNGIKVSLILSQDGIIVCGHQRYKIAQELKIPENKIPITIVGFSNREEMIEFAVNDNVLRRNLNMYQKAVLGLRLLPIYKKEAKQRISAGGKGGIDKGTQTFGELGEAIKIVAKRVGVSHESLRKVSNILDSEVTTDLHNDVLLTGERSITSVYKEIKEREEALEAVRKEGKEAGVNPKDIKPCKTPSEIAYDSPSSESVYDSPSPKIFELLRKCFRLNKQLNKKDAIKEKFISITDKEGVIVIVGKSEYAKELLAPFVYTDANYNKLQGVKWDKLPGELLRSNLSIRHLSYICEILKRLNIDVIDFCMKDNAPIQLQTDEFRFILASCKREEPKEKVNDK